MHVYRESKDIIIIYVRVVPSIGRLYDSKIPRQSDQTAIILILGNTNPHDNIYTGGTKEKMIMNVQ